MQKMPPDCTQERVFGYKNTSKMPQECVFGIQNAQKNFRLRRAYCYRNPLSNASKVQFFRACGGPT